MYMLGKISVIIGQNDLLSRTVKTCKLDLLSELNVCVFGG